MNRWRLGREREAEGSEQQGDVLLRLETERDSAKPNPKEN